MVFARIKNIIFILKKPPFNQDHKDLMEENEKHISNKV